MRKYLLGGGLAIVLVFALVGSASGKSEFTKNNHVQGLDSAVEDGGNQLTARSGPLHIVGEDYQDPDTQTKKAGRVRLLFDEGITVNTDKFPTCSGADRQKLEGTSSADAKKICGHAQVSIDGPANSQAAAALNFGPGAIAVVYPEVTAFNGPKLNGNPTLILHTFLSSPVANTTVLDGQLIQQGGRTLLDVDKIPPLAGGLGALTDFYATLNAETKDEAAIKKAKKQVKKANKKVKKAKKQVRKAKGKKKKKAKKKFKKAKKQKKKAQKKLRKAKKKKVNYIEAKCTGGSYETDGHWNLGRYDDPTDLNSFVTEFEIMGQDSVACKSNGDTVQPFDPGPGRG